MTNPCWRCTCIIAFAALSVALAACGKSALLSNPQAAPAAVGAPPATQPGAAAAADWQQLALQSRNLNAIADSPRHARIRVQPQAPADLEAKTGSATSPILRSLPLPAELQPSLARAASDFTADDLVRDASSFDPALPHFAMTTQPDAAQATFNCATNPGSPALDASAWATYRFQFTNFDTSSLPQSLGLLWAADDAPSRYFVGLADWNANRWQWFEGDNDNVITVASLGDFIRPDFVLLAVVMVMDNEARQLEFVQVGATETRGLGGMAPETMAGQDFSTPELYFPGKSGSALQGAPPEYILPLDYLGQAYDQGQQLACTACAVAGAQNFELATNYAPYWHYWDMGLRTSPKWLYRNTLFGNCSIGRPPESIMDFLKSTGGATFRNAPYNTNCNNDWYAEANNDAAVLKIDGYTKIRSRGQTGIDEIKYALHEWGRPVIFLITIDQTLKDSADDTFDNGAVWTWDDWIPNVLYWHTMLITGWDDAKQAFVVRNSWGPEWGDSGDFYVSYATFLGQAWIDCFVLWDYWNADTAAYFAVNDASYANVPANFEAQGGQQLDQVKLVWDAVSFADEYLIYRDTKDSPLATVPANATSYDDPGISDHYGHSYWIRARVGGATSPYSAPQLGWLQLPPAPNIEAVFGPDNIKVGDTISLSARCYNPLGLELSYSWAFAPGAVAEGDTLSGRMPPVTFLTSGSQAVTLTVDNGTDTAELSFSLNVVPIPQHPVAQIAGPAKGKKSKVLYFDASGSTFDAGQSITEYYWDWDGNGAYDESGGSPAVGHIFGAYGSYNVQLKVRDSRGLYSNWYVHPIEITPYDEVEDNDSCFAPNVLSMLAHVNYRGSAGSRAGYPGFDGDQTDWWNLPAEPGNSWVRVDYNLAEITGITVTVWDEAFSFSATDSDADLNGRAEVLYPPFASTTVLVEVKVTGGGGDYTISWEHPAL